MKNKINKTLNLMLLLSMLNGNMLSMQKSDLGPEIQTMATGQGVQQERGLSTLPNEIIEYIIYQIIKPHEGRIKSVNNIFEFYSQIVLLKEDVRGVALTSKDLRLWTLDVINRLKKLKEKKYQDLVNSIKNQHQNLSQNLNLDELNSRLKNILKRYNIDRNNLEEAAKLILVGANVNEKNNIGNTALMRVARWDHKDIVQLLIDGGANVNEKSKNGNSALMYAAINGHIGIVQLLIDNKANINEKNNNRFTALMYAAKYGHNSIVQLLISGGSNVNEKCTRQRTALMYAAINGHKDIVQLLIDNKANINEKNNNRFTALTLAVINGHKGIVQLLIDNSANVNVRDYKGRTALMLAKIKGHKDIVKLLDAVKNKENQNN